MSGVKDGSLDLPLKNLEIVSVIIPLTSDIAAPGRFYQTNLLILMVSFNARGGFLKLGGATRLNFP